MTGKQKQPLYTCLISKDSLSLKRLLFVAGLLQGWRRENSTPHRDGQTRKAREENPSLGYKDLFLASPPTPKAKRQVRKT